MQTINDARWGLALMLGFAFLPGCAASAVPALPLAAAVAPAVPAAPLVVARGRLAWQGAYHLLASQKAVTAADVRAVVLTLTKAGDSTALVSLRVAASQFNDAVVLSNLTADTAYVLTAQALGDGDVDLTGAAAANRTTFRTSAPVAGGVEQFCDIGAIRVQLKDVPYQGVAQTQNTTPFDIAAGSFKQADGGEVLGSPVDTSYSAVLADFELSYDGTLKLYKLRNKTASLLLVDLVRAVNGAVVDTGLVGAGETIYLDPGNSGNQAYNLRVNGTVLAYGAK